MKKEYSENISVEQRDGEIYLTTERKITKRRKFSSFEQGKRRLFQEKVMHRASEGFFAVAGAMGATWGIETMQDGFRGDNDYSTIATGSTKIIVAVLLPVARARLGKKDAETNKREITELKDAQEKQAAVIFEI